MTQHPFIARLAAILALALTFALPQARAGDKPVTFVATVSGMVCDGCKAHVRESFAKLEGVSSVEVAAGTAPGTHAVTVISKSDTLTKEQAITSLGAEASTYVVQSWEKK